MQHVIYIIVSYKWSIDFWIYDKYMCVSDPIIQPEKRWSYIKKICWKKNNKIFSFKTLFWKNIGFRNLLSIFEFNYSTCESKSKMQNNIFPFKILSSRR